MLIPQEDIIFLNKFKIVSKVIFRSSLQYSSFLCNKKGLSAFFLQEIKKTLWLIRFKFYGRMTK